MHPETDSRDSTTTQRRSGRTHQKHIYLTEFGRAKIDAWAEANRLNFSAAIETLALLGLEDSRADYAIPALRATTLQGLQLVFNRFARLLSDMAIEAATARTLAEIALLQIVRAAEATHPDDFEALMRVSRDGRRQGDVRIRRFHDDIKQAAEQDAIRRLRRSTARVAALFDEAGDAQPDTADAPA